MALGRVRCGTRPARSGADMNDDRPVWRLTAADHVLIHGVGVLLSEVFPVNSEAETVQAILQDVLHDVTVDNPALARFVEAARDLIHRPVTGIDRFKWSDVLRDYHLRRMAAAWDPIRERYHHG